jgi:ABC-type uncharacterized transport system permease subunit
MKTTFPSHFSGTEKIFLFIIPVTIIYSVTRLMLLLRQERAFQILSIPEQNGKALLPAR